MLNIKQHKNIKMHTAQSRTGKRKHSTNSEYRVRPKLGLVVIEGINNERALESSSFYSHFNISPVCISKMMKE